MFRSRRRFSRSEDVGETPNTPVNWRRFLGYLKPYRGRMVIAFIGTILSAALSLVFPAVIQNVVDSVFVNRDLRLLDQITLMLLFVFLLRSATSLIETFNLNYIGERITYDVRLELYQHLQDLSLGFFEKRRVGELVSRLSSDVTIMRQALTSNLGTFIQQVIILVGAVIVMLALNWRLTLFILTLIPIIVAVGAVFGMLMRRTSTQVQDEIAAATVIVDEVFQNIRVVKSFVREDFENERYQSAMTRAFRAAIRVLRIRAVFGPLMAFLGFGSLALILWYGGREVLDGRLTAGELIAFLVYGITVAGSIGSLVNLYASLQEALGATRRVFELIDQQSLVEDLPNAQVLGRVEGRITFDGVHFSYDAEQEVLHDINIDVAPGEILALVGPSGAGKSTIFNLIPRFYDPTSGAIRVDGTDIKTVTQDSLRSQIGIVPQETLLFGGTILENIRYGRLDASMDDVIAAAKAANAHDFIDGLPAKYETIVGERGVRLSGGQRQRVAIARAILKDPRILLLDEATSSLDSESEHLVQDALARLMQNRTTVIIAHRLSTIRVAHRIAVLDKGSITELGTHDQLMARGGLYAKLYEMQFREDLLTSASD
jgi:ATP-binding cassette, subfamily B, bacterial MsbA